MNYLARLTLVLLVVLLVGCGSAQEAEISRAPLATERSVVADAPSTTPETAAPSTETSVPSTMTETVVPTSPATETSVPPTATETVVPTSPATETAVPPASTATTAPPMATETTAPAGTGTEGESLTAEIAGFIFKPSTIEVPAGTTVSWTNRDEIGHSVTHGTAEQPGGAFDSGIFTQGDNFSFTFTEPGEYPYFCSRHPSMQGLVRVLAP